MKAELEADILDDVASGAQTTGLEEGLFQFSQTGMILQCSGADSVMAFAAKIPAEAFYEYKVEDKTEFGLGFDKITGFIGSTSGPVSLESDGAGIIMDDGNFSAEMATVQPQYVEGAADKLPSIDFELTIKDQPDFLTSFISRVDSLFEPSTYMIGAREDGVYLYSENENNRADGHYEWDEFDDYILNWGAGNDGKPGSHTPSEDHAMDVRMSMDFTKSLKSLGGDSILRFSNQGPMKWVFTRDNGVKMSYFQAPRMSDEGYDDVIPEEVVGKDMDENQLQLS